MSQKNTPQTPPAAKSGWYYFKRFWTFIKPYKRPLSTVYFLYLVNSIINLIPAFSVRFYIDCILLDKDASFLGMTFHPLANPTIHNKIMFSAEFLAVMAILIVGANCVGVAMWRLSTRSVEQVLMDIKIILNNHINKLSLSYFNDERVGTIMTKAIGDAGNVGTFLRNSFNLTYSIVQFLLAPFLMIALAPALFLLVLVPVPMMAYAFYSINRRLKPMYKEQRENEQVINSQMQEIVSGIKEIKAFNMEDRSSDVYRKLNRQSYDIQNRIMRVFSFNHQLQYGSKDFATILIAVAGGIMMFSGFGGGMSVGTITSFLMLSGYFYGPISSFLGVYDSMQRGMVSLERIVDFLEVVPDVKDRKNAGNLDRSAVKGTVSYTGASFAYVKGEPVLDKVSFEVRSGEKIAIVGPSGSGKSTLLSLLMRFYDVDEGAITIDETDIRDVTQLSLRQNIGIVFQETFLFYGTIRDNLMFVDPHRTEEELMNACKVANIHDTIMELPDKYETVVGERGVKLSGGQKQRLSIARVVLKNPAIVVLDEATSAVDTVTEKLIQASIDRMLENRTSFIIAHRLSTVTQCDRIIVLDNHSIAEMGSHAELLEKKGIYARLHEMNKI